MIKTMKLKKNIYVRNFMVYLMADKYIGLYIWPSEGVKNSIA